MKLRGVKIVALNLLSTNVSSAEEISMSMIAPILAQINLFESILGFIVVVVFTFLMITWLMSFIRFQDN